MIRKICFWIAVPGVTSILLGIKVSTGLKTNLTIAIYALCMVICLVISTMQKGADGFISPLLIGFLTFWDGFLINKMISWISKPFSWLYVLFTVGALITVTLTVVHCKNIILSELEPNEDEDEEEGK